MSSFGMTLRLGQRENYYAFLDKYYPGVKQKYIDTFGSCYICPVPTVQEVYKIFVEECEKYGLLYKMDDIIAASLKK